MPRKKTTNPALEKPERDLPLRSPEETPAELPPHIFLTRYQCPRCQSWQTKRTGQDGPIQYRKCENPVCRHNFKATAITPKGATA